MKYKKWIKINIIISVSVLLLIGSFNYFIDPLWITDHKHKFNQVQSNFNERQIKTNYITFNDFDYDTLLLGTSRTTYIDQNDFVGLKVYNYAVSSMRVEEYNDYIQYAKEQNGKDFDYIILELYYKSFDTEITESPNEPSHYIDEANRPLYSLSTLLSLDALEVSFKNLLKSTIYKSVGQKYNRENVASIDHISTKETINMKKKFLEENLNQTYESNYNDEYLDLLTEIKENNPNTKFIIFTNPLTSYSLKTDVREEQSFKDYERWLTEIVKVFDNVYNFTYINSITDDINNYYDSHHFYPEVGTLIAHRIIEHDNNDIPSDFGVKVNESNLKSHLTFVREQLGIDE